MPDRPSNPSPARRVGRAALLTAWLAVVIAVLALSDGGAQGARTTIINASEDTYITSGSPDQNFGGAASLGVGGRSARKAALVRFPLTGIPGDARVLSAKLRFYVVKSSKDAGSVSRVNGEWSEMYTTWRNAPAAGPAVANLSSPATTGTWLEADVTSQIGPANSVAFFVTSGSRREVYYSSRENSAGGAHLTIEWEPATTNTPNQSSPTPTPTPNPSSQTPQPATSSPTPAPSLAAPTPQPGAPSGGSTVPATPPPSSPTASDPTPLPPPAAPTGGQQGRVKFFKKADGGFDPFAATSSGRDFANARYSGMLMYPPASDPYTWYQGTGFFYIDSYAIYGDTNPAGATQAHALRDGTGQLCKLGGQWMYAADVGNADFRARMVSYIVSKLQLPQYDGVYLDDVNLNFNITCPSGGPIDPRTGQVMTADNWKRYMVEFLEQVRASTSKLIIHNTVWYTHAFDDPYRLRELNAANYVEIEFGFVDQGMTGGTGTYSWSRKAQWIDLAHSRGVRIISQDFWHFQTLSTIQRKFGLANYFLFNEGDYYSTFQNALPSDWDAAYETNLGSALGSRYSWNGLWRRDFENGFVLVNPPGSPTQSVSLGGTYTEIWGGGVSSLTLGERQGAILRR